MSFPVYMAARRTQRSGVCRKRATAKHTIERDSWSAVQSKFESGPDWSGTLLGSAFTAAWWVAVERSVHLRMEIGQQKWSRNRNCVGALARRGDVDFCRDLFVNWSARYREIGNFVTLVAPV